MVHKATIATEVSARRGWDDFFAEDGSLPRSTVVHGSMHATCVDTYDVQFFFFCIYNNNRKQTGAQGSVCIS
jgi:hypothetical protein